MPKAVSEAALDWFVGPPASGDNHLGIHRTEGYLGCLLGGLGQELSGVNEVFRAQIDACLSEISRRIALCLEEARQRGDVAPDTDPRQMADLLVDCWEGAALRTRLCRDPASLGAMLDFCFARATSS